MNRLLGGARTLGGAAVAAGVAVEFFIYDVDAGNRAVIFDKVWLHFFLLLNPISHVSNSRLLRWLLV